MAAGVKDSVVCRHFGKKYKDVDSLYCTMQVPFRLGQSELSDHDRVQSVL